LVNSATNQNYTLEFTNLSAIYVNTNTSMNATYLIQVNQTSNHTVVYNFTIQGDGGVSVLINDSSEVTSVNLSQFQTATFLITANSGTIGIFNISVFATNINNETIVLNSSDDILLTLNTTATPDIAAPTWNQTPANISVNNQTPIGIVYNATDDVSVDKYYINDTVNFAMNMTSGLFQNAQPLAVGNYSVLISVNDTSNNTLSSVINVKITEADVTPPIVTTTNPDDATNWTTTTHVFTNDIMDNKDIANVTLFGNWSGSWSANETNSSGLNNVEYNFTKTLPQGTHLCNVYACDSSGNCAFDTGGNKTLTIDSIAPIISNVINHTITNETAVLNWTTNELTNYTINFGSNLSLTEINKSPGTNTFYGQTLIGLTNGTTYYYNITGCDWIGLCSTDGPYMFITSRNNMAPFFDQNQDNISDSISFGTVVKNTVFSKIIYATDYDLFNVYDNLTFTFSNASSNIENISFVKINNNTANISFTPILDGNGTILLKVQDENNTFDLENVSFTILNPAMPPVVHEINPHYNLSTNVTVFDFGNATPFKPNNTVYVNLNENSTVTFDAIVENDTSITNNNLTFKWYVDNVLNSTILDAKPGTDSNLTYYFNFFSNGTTNITLQSTDSRFSSTNWTWVVSVNDVNRPPQYVGDLENLSVNYSTTYVNYFSYRLGVQRFYDADEDLNKDGIRSSDFGENTTLNYSISDTGVCGLGSVNFSGDDLTIVPTVTGICIVTFNATDFMGESVQSGQVTITVIGAPDITPPTWNQTPNDLTFEYPATISTQYNASDDQAISIYFIDDTENFSITTNGLFTNATNLGLGSYAVNISVNDSSNNILTTGVILNVTDTTAPVFNQTPVNITYNNETPINIVYNASDNLAIDQFYVDDTENFTINKTTGLFQKAQPIPVGNYTVTISVNDTQSLFVSHLINVEIVFNDVNAPTWNETPTDITLEYPATVAIQYNASDNAAVDIYYITSNVNFSMTTTGLLTNATTLGLGIYIVNISVNDTSNNIRTNLITINVSDTTAPVIFGVLNYTITNQSAIINWTTGEAGNSSVSYGVTQALASGTSNAAGFVTAHSRSLTGLSNGTAYYYNVTSCDVIGNCATSGPYSFITVNNPDSVAPVVILSIPVSGTNTSNPLIYFNASI